MKIRMNSDIVKVSTYAKGKGISVQAVYYQIKTGKIECVKIDGIKFIKVG